MSEIEMTDRQVVGPWRFFVDRMDYGRVVSIVFTKAVMRDELHIHALIPTGRCIMGQQQMQGNESATTFFTKEEAQNLVDALYEAGLRPTRGERP